MISIALEAGGGDLSGSANPATIVMDGDRTVTAKMTKYLYTINVNADNGSVIIFTESETYAPGTALIL